MSVSSMRLPDDETFQMDEDFARENLPDEPHIPTLGFILENQSPSHNGAMSINDLLSRYRLTNPSGQSGRRPRCVVGIEAPEYAEDADDMLDVSLQARLQKEYEEKLLAASLGTRHREPLCPPDNFAPVVNEIYRSSFPQPANFEFLKKLKLRLILCLIPEDYPQLQVDFLANENIELFQLGMLGNKEPFVKISSDLITQAAKIVLNPANQPILIHCNRGKHRTGCLVGIIRRLQRWSLTIILDEYRKFASPKERPMDQQFIELYDLTEIEEYADSNELLPLLWD